MSLTAPSYITTSAVGDEHARQCGSATLKYCGLFQVMSQKHALLCLSTAAYTGQGRGSDHDA